jgi:hypothetical protein
MHGIFKNFRMGDLMTMKFPATLVLLYGQEIVVKSNTEMMNPFYTAMNSCDEDDDFDYKDDNLDDAGLIAALTSGKWKIHEAVESGGGHNFTDNTSQFSNFSFTFLTNGQATASNGTTTVQGTWAPRAPRVYRTSEEAQFHVPNHL